MKTPSRRAPVENGAKIEKLRRTPECSCPMQILQADTDTASKCCCGCKCGGRNFRSCCARRFQARELLCRRSALLWSSCVSVIKDVGAGYVAVLLIAGAVPVFSARHAGCSGRRHVGAASVHAPAGRFAFVRSCRIARDSVRSAGIIPPGSSVLRGGRSRSRVRLGASVFGSGLYVSAAANRHSSAQQHKSEKLVHNLFPCLVGCICRRTWLDTHAQSSANAAQVLALRR